MERKRRGPETAERRAQAEALANTGALISLFALRSWRNDRVRATGKPEIICWRIGLELGVGEEFSISLAVRVTNSDGCRVRVTC
jgi:hypothetical protein